MLLCWCCNTCQTFFGIGQNGTYKSVPVAERLFSRSANTAGCQLRCSVTFYCVIHSMWAYMHSSIPVIIHFICLPYGKMNVSYLLYPAYHSCIAIALFLYSICSYHQMSIFILSPSAEAQNGTLTGFSLTFGLPVALSPAGQ